MKFWFILLVVFGGIAIPGWLSAQVDSSLSHGPIRDSTATEVVDTSAYWVLRGNVEVKLNRKKQKLVYRLHVEPTSRIWASITSSGIEGVRLLIRTDSFFILNRLTDEVLQGGVDVLSQQVGVGGGFEALVELLKGTAGWATSRGSIIKSNRNETIYLLTDSSTFRNVVKMNGQTDGLAEARLLRLKDGMEAHLDLADFRKVSFGNIPFILKFTTQNTQNPFQAQLRHSRVEVPSEPPTFKFVIPAHFRRRNW